MVGIGNLRMYGRVYVLMSTTASGIQSVIIKTSDDIDPFLMASFRSLMVFLVALCLVSWRTEVLYFPPGRLRLMSIRSTCSSIAIILNYYTYRHLALCDVQFIEAISPVFVTVYAFVLLCEPCGLFEILSIGVSLVGMVLVMQPPILFEPLTVNEGNSDHFLYSVVVLVGTLIGAAGVTLTRALKDIDVLVLTLWNSFFGIFPGLILHLICNASRTHFLNTIHNHWLTLMTVSILCFFSQLFFISALKTNHANVISLTRKSGDIVFAFILQIVFFNDFPNAFSLIGASLILSTLLATHFRRPSPQIVNLCRLPVHYVPIKVR